MTEEDWGKFVIGCIVLFLVLLSCFLCFVGEGVLNTLDSEGIRIGQCLSYTILCGPPLLPWVIAYILARHAIEIARRD